jgi:hypothetical protein
VPPRFAYWTILIDNAPTAFRARDPEELRPTLNQLKRTNKNVVMKWFARGRLWETQQQERDDFQRRKRAPRPQRTRETRGRDWRPGGQHKDPRARFQKKTRARHEERPERPEKREKKPADPPPRRTVEPRDPAPEPPPPPEQIVIKPEPPERG